MPFTPSHVAAALPFLRTPLLPAAVVMGTMVPDLPYYVPLFVPRSLSHSLLGLVTIDLLLGIASTLVWWFLVREPVIDALPRGIGSRIPAISRVAWRPARWGVPLTAAILLLSVLVGAATHVLWDAFTHPGWLVDHVAILRASVGPLALYKWLQYASSIGGLAIVANWAIRRVRRIPPDASRQSRFTPGTRHAAWALVIAAGLACGLAAWIWGMVGGSVPFDPSLVFRVARIGIGAALAASVIVVVVWYTALRDQSGAGSR